MNVENEIKIEISGPTNSGKSRITYMILKLLESHGFKVLFTDTDMSNEDFLKHCEKSLEDTLKNISEKSVIKITQKQVGRKFPKTP